MHQDALNDQLLQLTDVGAVEQVVVFANPCQQSLFCRERNNVLLADAQMVRGVVANTVNGFLGVLLALKVVP